MGVALKEISSMQSKKVRADGGKFKELTLAQDAMSPTSAAGAEERKNDMTINSDINDLFTPELRDSIAAKSRKNFIAKNIRMSKQRLESHRWMSNQNVVAMMNFEPASDLISEGQTQRTQSQLGS